MTYINHELKAFSLLLAEDNENTREILIEQLSPYFKSVETAENGSEAFKKLSKNTPDLILSDYMMPVMDGLEFCKKVKSCEQFRYIPFVLLTVLNKKEKKFSAIEAGADDFLTKPYEADELLIKIKSLLRMKKLQDEFRLKNEKLKELQAKLIQSAKMAAVGQLGAGIAHELNQPLTGIRGFAMMLKKKISAGETDKNEEYLERIIEQTERMMKIIRNIKLFSHQSGSCFEYCSLNRPVTDAVMLIDNQLRINGIELIQELDFSLPDIYIDHLKLQQVVLNLLQNAMDAILTISGKRLIKLKTFGKESPTGNLCIEISDTGCGIKKDLLEDIFNPFFTTKAPDKGTGLGLSISHSIIAEHGGKITVSSEENKGTIFTIEIPIEQKEKKNE